MNIKKIPFEDFDGDKEELEKRKFVKERIIEDLENYFENKRKQLPIKIGQVFYLSTVKNHVLIRKH